jgi:uncharacterized membrane protein
MKVINWQQTDFGKLATTGLALVFFASCTWTSYAHWSNFEYRTFDLAYYVQALWQVLHGRFSVSVEGVPLLGNHVEPVLLLLLPFFALCQHPLVPVFVQNAALAAMAPLGFSTARRAGLGQTSATLLASALLLTPATGYVALHEFHPEAFAAPFVLLIIHARRTSSAALHWIGIAMLLACKENMALLVAAYCAVHLLLERERPLAQLRRWYLWPLALSVGWLLLCVKVITPALNAGAIDYLSLYDRLGHSPGGILINMVTEPHRIVGAMNQSLVQGNLLPGLLLPFLGLPLFRPRWLVVGIPILLQHLLSWRSSEWQIYFHYAAPLIPLFWIATVESTGRLTGAQRFSSSVRFAIPCAVVIACGIAQANLGPVQTIASSIAEWRAGEAARARKASFIAQILPEASVVAPLPYLSHLAMRENLYSLHYILKGLKTLSRSDYEPPPPTDYVLIDYHDSATFDPIAGYYHPAMKTVDARVIPSSDRLLHNFLKGASWSVNACDELTLFRQTSSPAAEQPPADIVAPEGSLQVGPNTWLESIAKSSDVLSGDGSIEVTTKWNFHEPRQVFPWMFVRLSPTGRWNVVTIHRGLCAIERSAGLAEEKWRITAMPGIPSGEYDAEAVFVDYPRLLWASQAADQAHAPAEILGRISLGRLKVLPAVVAEK